MVSRVVGKLGAQPITHDPRTLRFADYTPTLGLLDPPKARDWLQVIPENQWGVLANDRYGCCVESAAGHMEQMWSKAKTGKEQVVTDDQVIQAYSAITGFIEGDTTSDQGTDPMDALRYWKRHGMYGHKINAYVEVDLNHTNQLKWAIELFGSLYAAIDFPESAMAQFELGQPWTHVPGSPSLGGHMIMLGAYDDNYIDLITWGARQRMTWEFWHAYRQAGFAVFSTQWTGSHGKSPAGFNIKKLKADLAAIPGTM
jgi:hypothetical protein